MIKKKPRMNNTAYSINNLVCQCGWMRMYAYLEYGKTRTLPQGDAPSALALFMKTSKAELLCLR